MIPRDLNKMERFVLREKIKSLSKEELIEAYRKAWELVDKNPYCIVCRRKFASKHGLAIHSGRAHPGEFVTLRLHDFYLAKILGVFGEENGE